MWLGDVQADYFGIASNNDALTNKFIEMSSDVPLLALSAKANEPEGPDGSTTNINRCLSENEHWQFWNLHKPALLITDTGNRRNMFYKTKFDNFDVLGPESIKQVAKLTLSLEQFVANFKDQI